MEARSCTVITFCDDVEEDETNSDSAADADVSAAPGKSLQLHLSSSRQLVLLDQSHTQLSRHCLLRAVMAGSAVDRVITLDLSLCHTKMICSMHRSARWITCGDDALCAVCLCPNDVSDPVLRLMIHGRI